VVHFEVEFTQELFSLISMHFSPPQAERRNAAKPEWLDRIPDSAASSAVWLPEAKGEL